MSVVLPTGVNPEGVAIGNFNDDDFQDIAVSNRVSNSISTLLGNGLGGFTSSTTVNTDLEPFALIAGDVNSDGNPDLLSANFTANTVNVFLGFGGEECDDGNNTNGDGCSAVCTE